MRGSRSPPGAARAPTSPGRPPGCAGAARRTQWGWWRRHAGPGSGPPPARWAGAWALGVDRGGHGTARAVEAGPLDRAPVGADPLAELAHDGEGDDGGADVG